MGIRKGRVSRENVEVCVEEACAKKRKSREKIIRKMEEPRSSAGLENGEEGRGIAREGRWKSGGRR